MAQTRLKSGNLHMVGGDNGTTGQVIKSKGDGTMEWGVAIDPPTFSSVDYPGNDTALDPAGSQSLVINGAFFNTGVTCTIDGTTPSSITRNSATQLTVTTPAKAAGTYALVISNTDGGSATVASAVSYNGIPAFTHAAGSLGSVAEEESVNLSVVATEPDGGAITHTIASGSLPSGLSLNASTGAITGTAPSVSADTTSNFTITATDNENQSVDRAYSITVTNLTPADHFNVIKYAGTGADHAIATVGFKPDFVWVKELDDGNENHNLYDSTRGVTKFLSTNNTNAEGTGASRLKSFDDLGFTMGSDNENNDSGANYVAWCWKANGGSTVSNTDGSITSTVQANTALGFSIVKYAGNVTAGATVGHGLGVAPSLIILKNMERAGYGWLVYHQSVSPTAGIVLNNSDAAHTTTGYFNDTATTSSVFSLGSDTFGNYNGDDYIAYCFADTAGFSKHGSYTGTGNSSGEIVETGFEPAFLMVKKTSDTGGWIMFDNARNTSNPRNNRIEGNNYQAEQTGSTSVLFDFYSNGFQAKGSNGEINASGASFAYIAFADPADTTTPALADSFNIKTYTGSGSAKSITELGFSPGFVLSKARSFTEKFNAFDIVRGALNRLYPTDTHSEASQSGSLTSFDSDGYSIGNWSDINTSTEDYVSWSWKADDDVPTAILPTQTVDDIKSTNLMLNLNLAGGSYPGSGTDLIDLSSAGEDFSRSSAGNVKAGFGGYYIDLEGNDQYWESDSSVATTTGDDITIEFWVRSESSSAQPSYADIMDANHSTGVTGSTGQGWAIQMRSSTQNSFYFLYYDGSGYQSNSDSEIFELTTNKWTHIAVVKSGTSVQIYEDGVAGTSWTATDATLENPNQKIRLGQYLNSDTRGFNGSLAQVRLYSVALSAGEVLSNYNATKDLFTVTTSVVSVNANAGFSIVKYTGTGADTKVPHGLSAAPDLLIVKGLETTNDWSVLHKDGTDNNFLQLNSDAAESGDGSIFGSTFTRPTATVFTVGDTGETGTADKEYIAYCWHSVTGYSKFGSYTGNSSSTNAITGLGFQPDCVIIKSMTFAEVWSIFDSERGANKRLTPSGTDVEYTDSGGGYLASFDSDGFTTQEGGSNDNNVNKEGETYIYAAFKIN